MTYDSFPDSLKHINRVRGLLAQIDHALYRRGYEHDMTKLEEPEKSIFDEYTPKLKETEYGSDQYKEYLKGMQVALDHHYATYRHHPEFHKNGIKDMNFIDLMEMLADWKAATERHEDGDLRKSIELNAKRFGYGPQMKKQLIGTAQELGWL